MKALFPILLIFVAIALFFMVIDPTYSKVKVLRAEQERLNQALNQSRELQKIRDELLSRRNTFSQGDIDRLTKLLPDHVDNVRLIIDIDAIAAAHKLRISSITLEGDSTKGNEPVIGPSPKPYGAVTLGFSVIAPYQEFISFMQDLEVSLRIVDATTLEFSATDATTNQYRIAIKTYWLH